MRKRFSHLLVLFFQFQIKLTNRKSVLRATTDKQKSTFSDKLTAETLHTHSSGIECNEELLKMEDTLANLERVLAKLNQISDEFFGAANEQGRLSKTSHMTFNEESANYTNMFNNATVLTSSPPASNRMPLLFMVVGVVVVGAFAAIFYLGHAHASKFE